MGQAAAYESAVKHVPKIDVIDESGAPAQEARILLAQR
jgi:hypothetical protein